MEVEKRRIPFGRGRGFVLALGVAVLVTGMALALGQPYLLCAFLQEDAFDAAFCGTYERLSAYDRRPEAAVDWLLAYHGEAPSTQVMITLADWATENPERFLDLLRRLESRDVEAFSERLADAVVQSGLDQAFAAALEGRKGDTRRQAVILRAIEDRRRVLTSLQTVPD